MYSSQSDGTTFLHRSVPAWKTKPREKKSNVQWSMPAKTRQRETKFDKQDLQNQKRFGRSCWIQIASGEQRRHYFFFAFCHPPCPILSISEYWTASGFGTEKKRARLCTLRKILLEKMISMYGTFCTHFVFGNKTECYLVTQRVRQDWPFCDISVCGQFRCVVWATGSLHSQIFLCSCRFHAKHGSRYEWNRISSRLMWAVIATIFCIMS